MLRPLLHSVDARLDAMLGPPCPLTPEDRKVWMPKGPVKFPPPPPPKWTPPARVPRSKDGTGWELAPRVICYQRSCAPKTRYQHFVNMAAKCFEPLAPDPIQTAYNLERMTYDFFLAIVSNDGKPAAGCVVEFRPPVSPDDPPYLYASTVCTDPRYGARGLAHQLIHAVYTLGALMLEQNATAAGMWRNAIPHGRLSIGLAVDEIPGPIPKRLEQLYSQCGLKRNADAGSIRYESFTRYSIYNWQIDEESDKFAMWQAVTPNVLYDDGSARILNPSRTGDGETMYHSFPQRHAGAVRSTGIVHHKHASLHEWPDGVYAPAAIRFSKQPPAEGTMAFCIRAETSMEALELRISVPAWFGFIISTQTPPSESAHRPWRGERPMEDGPRGPPPTTRQR